MLRIRITIIMQHKQFTTIFSLKQNYSLFTIPVCDIHFSMFSLSFLQQHPILFRLSALILLASCKWLSLSLSLSPSLYLLNILNFNKKPLETRKKNKKNKEKKQKQTKRFRVHECETKQ